MERAGIALSAADQVRSVRKDRVIQVEIARPVTTYETELAELLPYQTVRRENPELELGREQVVQTGRQGQVIETTRIVTDPDGTVHRSDLGRSVAEEPIEEIVEYGTRLPAVAASYLSVTSDVLTHVNAAEDGSGVLTTASGQTLRYARALTVTATAYTTERQSWKKTATGTIARVGAIAVDPKVIPYGTRMYIVSSDGTITYGVATAEDWRRQHQGQPGRSLLQYLQRVHPLRRAQLHRLYPGLNPSGKPPLPEVVFHALRPQFYSGYS